MKKSQTYSTSLISDNTFVSAIIHNTFATMPLSTIPYTGIPPTPMPATYRLTACCMLPVCGRTAHLSILGRKDVLVHARYRKTMPTLSKPIRV